MTAALHIVILAAGQGTRMKSERPKVLHPIGGKPMLAHVIGCARELGAEMIHVVHGHGAEQVRAWAQNSGIEADDLRWVLQSEQLGTGHAVQQAMPEVPADARVLVLYGDVPLIRPQTLQALIDAAGLCLLSVCLDDPGGYGRVLRDEQNQLSAIVEQKDADPQQRAINEVNTGMLAAPAAALQDWLTRIGNDNASGEYYLTDCISLAVSDRVPASAIVAKDPVEVAGINNRLQLSQQERALQHYGRYLGLAFQLIDDLLDYQGDAEAMGKNVGDDLAEGKPTLPLIHAMERGTPEQAKLIRQVIRKGGLEQLDDVLAIIHDTGALAYTRVRAEEMADKALAELDALPPSPYRDSMAQLARLAVDRQA